MAAILLMSQALTNTLLRVCFQNGVGAGPHDLGGRQPVSLKIKIAFNRRCASVDVNRRHAFRAGWNCLVSHWRVRARNISREASRQINASEYSDYVGFGKKRTCVSDARKGKTDPKAAVCGEAAAHA